MLFCFKAPRIQAALGFFMLLPAMPNLAWAAAPTPAATALQMLFGLVVVLALLMGIAWWLKRFGPVRSSSNSAAKIVGGVSVGTRERIVVVEVADQWIVVGVAPGSVNALSTMPRQELPTQVTTSPQGNTNFSAWLKQTIDKRNGKN